jgi:hypothetical protein
MVEQMNTLKSFAKAIMNSSLRGLPRDFTFFQKSCETLCSAFFAGTYGKRAQLGKCINLCQKYGEKRQRCIQEKNHLTLEKDR